MTCAEDARGVGLGDDERRDAAEGRLLLREPARRGLARGALGGHGGEHHRGQRGHGQEQLRREQAVGQRAAHERPRAVGGVPDRQCEPRGAATSRRPQRPEAERRPDQRPGTRRTARRAATRCSSGPRATAISRRPRSSRCRVGRQCAENHVSSAGVTTSAPERSESHHVRQMLSTLPAGRSPEIQIASRPQVAPRIVPAAEQTIRMMHVLDAQAGRARTQAQEQRGGHDDGDDRRQRLAGHDRERRRVVACEQVARHDGRPQARAEQDECRDADADRRPERREGRRGGRCRRRAGTRAGARSAPPRNTRPPSRRAPAGSGRRSTGPRGTRRGALPRTSPPSSPSLRSPRRNPLVHRAAGTSGPSGVALGG